MYMEILLILEMINIFNTVNSALSWFFYVVNVQYV